jgi:hypoxanthine-DNA glycosylase
MPKTPALAAPPPVLIGLPPVLAPHTRLLVLGSFPGVASLAAQQYYGHPRNQFWPIVGTLFKMDLMALPYEPRIAAVRERGLGIWDAYASCRRIGSLDSAIEAPQFNDFGTAQRIAPHIALVVHNGAESARAAARPSPGLAGAALAFNQPGECELEFGAQVGRMALGLRAGWAVR